MFIAASHDDDHPYPGNPPVRLTNAPLLFATTLSVALGISLAAAREKPQVETDPSLDAPPSSTQPSTERALQAPLG